MHINITESHFEYWVFQFEIGVGDRDLTVSFDNGLFTVKGNGNSYESNIIQMKKDGENVTYSLSKTLYCSFTRIAGEKTIRTFYKHVS